MLEPRLRSRRTVRRRSRSKPAAPPQKILAPAVGSHFGSVARVLGVQGDQVRVAVPVEVGGAGFITALEGDFPTVGSGKALGASPVDVQGHPLGHGAAQAVAEEHPARQRAAGWNNGRIGGADGTQGQRMLVQHLAAGSKEDQ